MNKVVKFNSVQSGEFNAQQNLIDFILPAGKQYDLEKSYINLVASCSQTDASGSGAVFNYYAEWSAQATGDTNSRAFDNSALVKNVRLTSDRVGTLEDIRRSDILRNQLCEYTKNLDDLMGKSYTQFSQHTNQGNMMYAPNIEFEKEGTRKSRVRDLNIQIPLKDILGLGSSDNLPCDKLGECRLHLEMNMEDKFDIAQWQGSGKRSSEFGNQLYTDFDDVSTAGALTEITTTSTFDTIDLSPYWVGQRLSVSLDISGANTTTESNITQIVHDTTTRKIKLTFADTLATIAANPAENIEVDGTNGTTTLIFNQAEIVLEQRGKTENVSELSYATYLNEQDAGNALTAFSKQYSVEQECFNLLVCLPDNSDLRCTNAGGTQYSDFRLRSDGVDLTNRNVELPGADDRPTSLYYDRLGMTLLNANLPLRNLTELIRNQTAGWDSRYTTDTLRNVFIGNPLPITPQRKLVQVSINGSGAGVNTIQLFKHVAKSIKL